MICRWLVVLMLVTRVAHADVPDATLAALRDRDVRLELVDGSEADGRVLGFDATSLTIAHAGTNEVVTLPRATVATIVFLEAPPDRPRTIAAQSSLLGTVLADVDYRWLHGFASANLLLPILTASGTGRWYAAAAGGGLSIPIGTTRRWRVDVLAQVVPLHTTSFYTYLGVGLGAGMHYTASNGLTLGLSFPVIGFATRLGHSPYGYDASFRYNDSLSYYYLGAIAGMPLLTFGYRFATGCPPKIARSSAVSDASAPSSK